jgi:porphobilinogen deaminase
MRAAVMSPDGSRVLRAHGEAAPAGAWQLGRDLAAELLRSGASDLISEPADHVPEGQANSRNDVQ